MEAGLAVAERLRATVQDTPFQVEGLELSLTISLGMTTLNEKNPDMSSLLKQADQALYIAKNTGRNRVVVC